MSVKALFLIAVAATVLGTALDASYTVGQGVGAPGGSWDLKTNYTRWASIFSFYDGDELRFQYSVVEHNVVEVSKTGHDACNSSSPIATYKTGNDAIALAAAGSRYFICGVSGHCSAGMKLQVDIKSKVVQCQGRGIRRRCRSQPSSSSAATSIDPSALARLGLAAVVAGIVLFL